MADAVADVKGVSSTPNSKDGDKKPGLLDGSKNILGGSKPKKDGDKVDSKPENDEGKVNGVKTDNDNVQSYEADFEKAESYSSAASLGSSLLLGVSGLFVLIV